MDEEYHYIDAMINEITYQMLSDNNDQTITAIHFFESAEFEEILRLYKQVLEEVFKKI